MLEPEADEHDVADRCERADPHGGDGHVLVLPDAQDGPAFGFEGCCDALVSGDVGVELGDPVVAVGLGHVAVLGAHVPEAAVDEHGDLGLGEDDVGVRADVAGADQQVLAEPQAHGVEGGAEPDLGLGVDPLVGLADLGGRRRGRLGVGHDPSAAEVHRPTRGHRTTLRTRGGAGSGGEPAPRRGSVGCRDRYISGAGLTRSAYSSLPRMRVVRSVMVSSPVARTSLMSANSVAVGARSSIER